VAIHREWLTENELLVADATDEAIDEAARWSELIFARSWEIVSKSLFVNDCVFSDSSNYPVSLEHAWWLAEEKNSLKDWDPAKENALETSEDNVRAVLAEKDEALRLVALEARLVARKPDALTGKAHSDLVTKFDTFQLYVAGWRAVVRACMLTKFLLDHPGTETRFSLEVQGMIPDALDDLLVQADRMRSAEARTDQHFAVYNMLGWERLRTLNADLKERLASLPDTIEARSAMAG
jgi:hypothetical protein